MSLVASNDSTFPLPPALRAVQGATPYVHFLIDRIKPCGLSPTSVLPFSSRGLRYFRSTPGTSLRLGFKCRDRTDDLQFMRLMLYQLRKHATCCDARSLSLTLLLGA